MQLGKTLAATWPDGCRQLGDTPEATRSAEVNVPRLDLGGNLLCEVNAAWPDLGSNTVYTAHATLLDSGGKLVYEVNAAWLDFGGNLA